jgi:hypothetical protein
MGAAWLAGRDHRLQFSNPDRTDAVTLFYRFLSSERPKPDLDYYAVFCGGTFPKRQLMSDTAFDTTGNSPKGHCRRYFPSGLVSSRR